MPELRMTPARLALLRDVADGEVWGRPDGRSTTIDATFGDVRFVTAQIGDLQRAGLVRLVHGAFGSRWQLTDAGRAVLDAHKEAEHG